MNFKRCSGCGKTKKINQFGSNVCRKDKHSIYCIPCSRKRDAKKRALRKTDFRFFVHFMYERIRSRVKSPWSKGSDYFGMDLCSRKDFFDIALNNKNLKSLFNNWVKSGNTLKLTPTTDRMDSGRGYSKDNIQFLSFFDNAKKGSTERWREDDVCPHCGRKLNLKVSPQ